MAQTADPIAPVLEQVEQNNRRLQAARELMKAEVLEAKAGNNLGNPEVNYAHLFNSERGSQQQSELTVVQGFDFPTAYAARSKAARLQGDAARDRQGLRHVATAEANARRDPLGQIMDRDRDDKQQNLIELCRLFGVTFLIRTRHFV